MIHIFLISDENYVKYATVTIKSVLSGTKEKINFYLLDGGISAESNKVISEMVNITGNSVEFIPMDLSLFKNFPDIAHFSLNMYFRYLIPELKPNLNKALYIDTDMIVGGDINKIYNTPLDGYGLAAVPYITEELQIKSFQKYKNNLNLPNNHLYFNSGLLLMDCKYWREHNVSNTLMTMTAKLFDKLKMPDQDILNIVFANNYKVLPRQYNLVVDETVKFLNINDYTNSKDDCFVLHFTGGKGIRPWMRFNIPCQKFFWNIAKQTPFYNELQSELLINQISLLEKNYNTTEYIKLFGFIPFLKIITQNQRKKIYLFDVILLFSSKIK